MVLFYGKSRINLELEKFLECNGKMLSKTCEDSNSLSFWANANHQIDWDSEKMWTKIIFTRIFLSADIPYHCVCLRVSYECFFYSYSRMKPIQFSEKISKMKNHRWKKKCYSILNSIFTTCTTVWKLLLKKANSITANTVYFIHPMWFITMALCDVEMLELWINGIQTWGVRIRLLIWFNRAHQSIKFEIDLTIDRLTHMAT